jgi:hypothetical protein
MLSPGQMEAQLNRLTVTNVCVKPALRGTLIRFGATKI